MHKKPEKNIIKIQTATTDLLGQVSQNSTEVTNKLSIMLDETVKTQAVLIDSIKFLYKAILFLSLMSTWILLLQDPINKNISTLINWWPELSEGWQILIISIPMLIIAQVAGNLITEKITKK